MRTSKQKKNAMEEDLKKIEDNIKKNEMEEDLKKKWKTTPKK